VTHPNRDDKSNLSENEYDDVDSEYGQLTGKLTWGRREMGADGRMLPSEQEEMFWTSLRGVNDNHD
jgi:hypothetical protein